VAVGGGADASYGDAPPIHRRGALDALFAPIHRAFASLLAATRSFCNAAIHSHLSQLKANLRKAGFVELTQRGKGSHTLWRHFPSGVTITMPGQDGDDAKSYLEREVRDKIRQATEARSNAGLRGPKDE